MEKQIECPGCGQGWVLHFRVPALQTELFVCEECETTWFSRSGIGHDTPMNFVTFMREHGLKGTWDEIERVEK